MSLAAGRRGAPPPVRLDDNAETYDAARDGRGAEGALRRVSLDRIAPSRFQVRLVFPEAEVDALADSILANGMIHEPRARPHPERPGWVELMPGEMRVRALHRLVERGEADAVLAPDGEGGWLVPVRLEETDDARAAAMVFGENYDRTDLSPWEWAVALGRRRARMRARGEPAGVRDVAASVGKRAYQRVGEYLQVADALGPEVLAGAGASTDGEPHHGRLARLPLAALLRVARAAARGPTAGAQRLLAELRAGGDPAAAALLRAREVALSGGACTGGFQLNIRQPLDQVAPPQAAGYLARIVPAVRVLAARAAGHPVPETPRLAEGLEAAAAALRAGPGCEADARTGSGQAQAAVPASPAGPSDSGSGAGASGIPSAVASSAWTRS